MEFCRVHSFASISNIHLTLEQVQKTPAQGRVFFRPTFLNIGPLL